MRIACISTSSVPSRKANSIEVMKVCQAFRVLEHEVKLWIPGSNPQMEWHLLREQYGLRVHFPIEWVPASALLRRYDFSLRAVWKAQQWGADLFYVWPFQTAALTSSLGLPTILELHDRPPGRSGPFLFRTFLRGKGALRLLPITQALLDWVNLEYSLELSEPFTRVSPSGVDLEQYQGLPDPSTARREWGLPEAFTVGYTGHLYPGRGLDLMFELARNLSDMRFIWVGGEDTAVEQWRQKSREAGITNLQLMGFVPNERLPSAQAACEVLLMPYETEVGISSGGDTAQFASPMKLFEYLASGRVILASELPVLREILNSGNARFASISDISSWQKELKKLQADPALRTQLGEQARRDSSLYTWEKRAQMSLADVEI
jgi:glycosyltransferase involved in cell wall biosynthesis